MLVVLLENRNRLSNIENVGRLAIYVGRVLLTCHTETAHLLQHVVFRHDMTLEKSVASDQAEERLCSDSIYTYHPVGHKLQTSIQKHLVPNGHSNVLDQDLLFSFSFLCNFKMQEK